MSYIGAQPTTGSFPFDQFSGNGSTTAFTLTYAPASTSSIIVAVSGVVQNPNAYSCIGTTLTFSGAPPAGTNNISVLYLGLPVIGVSSPGNTAYFSSTSFTATGGQTTFTPSGSYQVGFINVIRNGSQLAPADYTATNGTTVVLNNACTAGDVVVIEVYTLTSISNALPLTGGTVTGATTFNTDVTVNGALASGYTGFKNRIINGAMMIDQRNAGASVTGISSGTNYIVDRWALLELTDAVFTAGQDTSVPTGEGFVNSFKITTTTADASIGAGQYAFLVQRIEGNNIADLMFGSASAQTITFSFWVRSSITGTFSGALSNATFNYSYAFEYSISAADTWEKKTITISGATAGTWLTTNGIGLQVIFSMGHGSNFDGTVNTWESAGDLGTSGSVAVAGTLNATFYITGVQLERGSNATSFEFRDYGRELMMCQRYYQGNKVDGTAGAITGTPIFRGNNSAATGSFYYWMPFATYMRASPTVNVGTPTYSNANSALAFNATPSGVEVYLNITSATGYALIPWRAEVEL